MTIFLYSSFGLGSNAVILILENIGIIVQYPIRYVCKHHVGNEQRTPSLPSPFHLASGVAVDDEDDGDPNLDRRRRRVADRSSPLFM